MIGPFVEYLLKSVPWLAIVALAIWVAWKLSKYHSSLEDTKKKISSLPCESRGEGLKSIESGLAALRTASERMSGQLTEISKWVMKLDPAAIDTLAPKFSPRQIAKAGMELYEMCGAKKTLEENRDFFMGLVSSFHPQTPLDVEEACYTAIMGSLPNPIFNDIKNFVYYKPEEITLKNEKDEDVSVSLSLPLILRLMSLALRDMYLKANPSIK